MHPNAAFGFDDQQEMLGFVSQRGFAHVFASDEAGLYVAHLPVLVTTDGRIRFHLSRRNRAADRFAGRSVLISVSARDGYQSANWYASDDQVPTWHYEAVEVEGEAQPLSPEALVTLLDDLSAIMEERHSPERPWTRAKMDAGKFEAMTKAIVGFEVIPDAVRGTRKFNQHKSPEDLAATIAGQRAAGRADIVVAVQEATVRK